MIFSDLWQHDDDNDDDDDDDEDDEDDDNDDDDDLWGSLGIFGDLPQSLEIFSDLRHIFSDNLAVFGDLW